MSLTQVNFKMLLLKTKFSDFILFLIGIDTDKYKYPIGSGRVTFSSYQSYTKAVAASFVEVKTPKFSKKVRVSFNYFFFIDLYIVINFFIDSS